MIKFDKMNKQFFMFLILFFIVGLVLTYSVKDWVKENLLLPILEPLIWIYVLINSIPHNLFWGFFLLLGTIYVTRNIIVSFSGISLPKRAAKKEGIPSYLSSIMNLAEIKTNQYSKQQFAKYLTVLYFEMIGESESKYMKILEKFDLYEDRLPREVISVFRYGLKINSGSRKSESLSTEEVSRDNDIWKLFERILLFRKFFKVNNYEIDLTNQFPTEKDFESTLCFLEQQLFIEEETVFHES